MMIDGLVLMIITKGELWKFVSTMMFWLGGQFLYMELLRNPMDWTGEDIAVFCLALMCICLITLMQLARLSLLLQNLLKDWRYLLFSINLD